MLQASATALILSTNLRLRPWARRAHPHLRCREPLDDRTDLPACVGQPPLVFHAEGGPSPWSSRIAPTVFLRWRTPSFPARAPEPRSWWPTHLSSGGQSPSNPIIYYYHSRPPSQRKKRRRRLNLEAERLAGGRRSPALCASPNLFFRPPGKHDATTKQKRARSPPFAQRLLARWRHRRPRPPAATAGARQAPLRAAMPLFRAKKEKKKKKKKKKKKRKKKKKIKKEKKKKKKNKKKKNFKTHHHRE